MGGKDFSVTGLLRLMVARPSKVRRMTLACVIYMAIDSSHVQVIYMAIDSNRTLTELTIYKNYLMKKRALLEQLRISN